MAKDSRLRRGPTLRNRIGFYGGPVLAALVLVLDLEPGKPEVTRTAAMVVLMATWWVTEALPVPVTSLLPLVLLPLLGVLDAGATAGYYFRSHTALFLGGFLLALTIERWGLHRRMALHILSLVGDNPRRLVLGFLLGSAFLSMWISNTATAMIMLPIALSVTQQVTGAPSEATRAARNVPIAILLGVAYGSSVGGFATLVGTPPNIVLVQIFGDTFPDAPPLDFGSWLAFAWPISLVFQLVIWLLLVRVLVPVPAEGQAGSAELIKNELRALGPMSSEEKRVGLVFLATALLWVFRAPINLGLVELPGWSSLLPEKVQGFVKDGTVAMAAGIILFIVPAPSLRAGGSAPEGKASTHGSLLDWETTTRLPWGILLLFGGGFALAGAMEHSGLSAWVGGAFHGLATLPVPLLILGIALLLTFLTEVTSNTATTSLMLPVLAAVAKSVGCHPLLLMVPAVLSASCAFMLPVATPPNAIVYGSGRVPIARMALVGIVLNLVGALLVMGGVLLVGMPVLGVHGFPDWAR